MSTTLTLYDPHLQNYMPVVSSSYQYTAPHSQYTGDRTQRGPHGTRTCKVVCCFTLPHVNFMHEHIHHSCFKATVYTLTFTGLNFRGLPVFTIFAVRDVTTHPLPVWSTFLWDETFSNGYSNCAVSCPSTLILLHVIWFQLLYNICIRHTHICMHVYNTISWTVEHILSFIY